MNILKKNSKVIRIVALVLSIAILVAVAFIIRACSAPPSYDEIEERFKQLMNDAHEVNVVLFGKGLPTYERIYDPTSTTKVYNTGEYYTDEDGKEQERKIWYYRTVDTDREIYAFRSSYLEKFAYACVFDTLKTDAELKAMFPALDGAVVPDGKTLYSEIFRTEDSKKIAYLVPFAEKDVDFYYTAADPEDYDYVRDDAKCRTINEIKAFAETVYSRNYMLSLHSALFDGVAAGSLAVSARYVEYIEPTGVRLALLNTEEALFTERRVYLFDTAKILKWGSNKSFVRIELDTYLPSAPEKVTKAEINLVLQDGQWFLDSPTF